MAQEGGYGAIVPNPQQGEARHGDHRDRPAQQQANPVPEQASPELKHKLVQEKHDQPGKENGAIGHGGDGEGLDYYDVMMVGITGQGKSTTSEKMLVAFPEPLALDHQDADGDAGVEMNEEENVAGKNGRYTYSDFTFWTMSDVPKSKEISVVEYLKRLDLFRALEDTHLEVNFSRKNGDTNPVTGSCQLVSNEVTKLRTLDVPGFFSVQSDASASQVKNTGQALSLMDGIEMCTHNHLTIMRDILRIQSTMSVKFNRILYFLPIRGPLEKANEVLIQELLLLARYFGRSIFECMVLIATAQTRISLMPQMQGHLFTEEESDITREKFRTALTKAFPAYLKEDLPNPPLVFISMLDDCNSIVEKVKGANVTKDSLELTFHPGVCIKCPNTIKWLENEKIECIQGDAVIPYSESQCHPIFLPKNRHRFDFEVDLDGTVLILIEKLAGAETSEEECVNCGREPGSEGCMKVGDVHPVTGDSGRTIKITVDHTNQLERHKVLRQSMLDLGDENSSNSEGEDDRVCTGSPRAYEASDSGGYASELVVPDDSIRPVPRRRDRAHRDRQPHGQPGQAILVEEDSGERKG